MQSAQDHHVRRACVRGKRLRGAPKLNTRKLGTAAASVAALGVIGAGAAMAPDAFAYNHSHVYCHSSVGQNGTCPPHGSTQYEHLQANIATLDGGLANACVDAYLQSGLGGYYYTGATCTTFGGTASQPHSQLSGRYGYPRAWNDSFGTYYLHATEYWN